MFGIKSRRWVSRLNRLGLLAFFALSLQLGTSTAPRPPGTSDFATFALQSGLVELVGPGHTIDLCSHSDSSDQHQTAHNNCLLCLVAGAPPAHTDLLRAILVSHRPFEPSAISRDPGQVLWPAHLATGPPKALSV